MSATAIASGPSARKRAVNLTLTEGLIQEARAYTSNLSATMEELLEGYVRQQHQARSARQQEARACSEGWNTVQAAIGSFADGHSTL